MKNKTRYILLALFALQTLCIVGQNKQVWLHGKVVNQLDSMPIPLSQLASYKKIHLFAADTVGEFKVILSQSDSIKVIALGFEPRVFHLDSLNIDPDQVVLLPLQRATYKIQQVDINFYKAYNDYTTHLKEQRSKQMEMNLGMELGRAREIPAAIQPVYKRKPPVYMALVQPLSFIHYHTSKTEKQKVKMLKLMKDEKKRRLLSVELVKEVSGLNEKELEQFIVYCNANIKFNKRDTEISIKYKVIDLYEEYKKEAL